MASKVDGTAGRLDGTLGRVRDGREKRRQVSLPAAACVGDSWREAAAGGSPARRREENAAGRNARSPLADRKTKWAGSSSVDHAPRSARRFLRHGRVKQNPSKGWGRGKKQPKRRRRYRRRGTQRWRPSPFRSGSLADSSEAHHGAAKVQAAVPIRQTAAA